MKNEPEKLADILMGMVEAVEETDPEILYRDDYSPGDGDVYVARAAALIREQEKKLIDARKRLAEIGDRTSSRMNLDCNPLLCRSINEILYRK